MAKVKDVIRESGAHIPEVVLDRAHRVGKTKKIAGVKKQQVIVRFTTWYHRTLLNRNRKTLRDAKIYLDLTKPKFKLLKLSQEKVKDIPSDDFVFADINCALCVRLKNGEFQYFSTEVELDQILFKM